MLTLQILNELEPETIFATGVISNSPDGLYMTNTRVGDNLLWIAKRGVINDWAIYVHWEENGIEYVKTKGDKVNIHDIRKLISCDDQALERYRR